MEATSGRATGRTATVSSWGKANLRAKEIRGFNHLWPGNAYWAVGYGGVFEVLLELARRNGYGLEAICGSASARPVGARAPYY